MYEYLVHHYLNLHQLYVVGHQVDNHSYYESNINVKLNRNTDCIIILNTKTPIKIYMISTLLNIYICIYIYIYIYI